MIAVGAVASGAGRLIDPRLGAIIAVWFGAWALNASWPTGRGAASASSCRSSSAPRCWACGKWPSASTRSRPIILPAPSAIARPLPMNTTVLWADFQQTILKGALAGYVIGCGAAFLTAIAIDRSPFLQRGLLPVGNFIAALPIVGTAPILVMWFGFGWQSKAAVVVAMVFFPMLVNCVQGMKASERHAARPDAHLRRKLLAELGEAAPAHGASFHLQRFENLHDPCADRGHRCRIFRLSGRGHGLSHKNRGGAPGHGYGLGIDRRGRDGGHGVLRACGLIERRLTFWHPSQRTG
jgi:NitT/TauT family transport system permease protein